MRKPTTPRSRESGLTLVELSVSLVIFSFIVLSVGITLLTGFSQRRESFESYRAMNALRNRIARIQEDANFASDLSKQVGIASIYSKFDGSTLNVKGVPGGKLSIECFANEATVPAILGGPQDLNFDGDAADDLGNVSNGTDLKLIPMTFVLTYDVNGETHSVTAHRLITTTEDNPEVVSATKPDPNDPDHKPDPRGPGWWRYGNEPFVPDEHQGVPDYDELDIDPLF